MRNILVASVLAFALLSLAVPIASAATTVTVTAKETGCPKTFCFDLSTSTLTKDEQVTVNFNNPTGNTQHSFCVLQGATWNCAPASGFANGGTSATLTFTPSTEGKLEYKCGVPGHDVLGMVGNFTVQSASMGGNNTGGNGDGTTNTPPPKSSPSVGFVAILAGVGLLAVALRRR